jgi:hypothetical protein
LTPLFALSNYNFFKLPRLNGIEMCIPSPFKASFSCALIQLAGLELSSWFWGKFVLALLEATFFRIKIILPKRPQGTVFFSLQKTPKIYCLLNSIFL